MPLLSVGLLPVPVPMKTNIDAALLEDQITKQTITKNERYYQNWNQRIKTIHLQV